MTTTFGMQIRELRRNHHLGARRCAAWWGCAEGTWRSYEEAPDSHFNAALLNYMRLSIQAGQLRPKPSKTGLQHYNWDRRLKAEQPSAIEEERSYVALVQ